MSQWFIPAISLGFGVSSLGTAFVRTKAAACGVRFVLGIFEAGMMPGTSASKAWTGDQ